MILENVDRAITVRQPWAFAIAAGFKPVENRGVWCHYRGPVAIHSALQVDQYVGWPQREAADAYQAAGAGNNLWEAHWPPVPSKFRDPPDPRLALGGIIAVAELVGCHYPGDVPPTGRDNTCECCPDWGQYWYLNSLAAEPKRAVHIELANVQALRHAIPARGRLGVPWRLDDDLVAAVAAELQALDDSKTTSRPAPTGGHP